MGLTIGQVKAWIAAGLSDEDIQVLMDHWLAGVPPFSFPPDPPITIPPISPLKKSKGEGKGGAGGKTPQQRGTRIPDDFSVPDHDVAWAIEYEGFDIETLRRETDNFVDYWQSASQRAVKCDWVKAWRVWMRRVAQDGKNRQVQLNVGRQNGTGFRRDSR